MGMIPASAPQFKIVPILILMLILCGIGASAETIPEGTYQGTVAGLPVSVQFSEGRSLYYYQKIGKNIDLISIPDKPGFYQESDPSHPGYAEDFDPASDAWWEISVRGDEITGVWKSGPKGGRPLKILLHRVTESEFEAHRLLLPYAPKKTMDLHGVRLKSSAHPVTGITLLQIVSGIPAKAASRINQNLAEQASSMNQRWVDCSSWTGGMEPAFVSQVWMTFDINSSGFCGGFQVNETWIPLSYDSNTGESIDFGSWIDLPYWHEGHVQDGLRDLVAKQLGVEECANRAKTIDSDSFTPWMGSNGFNFRLAAMDGPLVPCDGDYPVPFAQMRKFITSDRAGLYDHFVAATVQAK